MLVVKVATIASCTTWCAAWQAMTCIQRGLICGWAWRAGAHRAQRIGMFLFEHCAERGKHKRKWRRSWKAGELLCALAVQDTQTLYEEMVAKALMSKKMMIGLTLMTISQDQVMDMTMVRDLLGIRKKVAKDNPQLMCKADFAKQIEVTVSRYGSAPAIPQLC